MQLEHHRPARLARLCFCVLMLLAWSGQPALAQAADANAGAPAPAAARAGLTSEQALDRLDRTLAALEAADKQTPRDTFDPEAIVAAVGKDPAALLAWVRDHTAWVPYHGTLRGWRGTLMDRRGNHLDRALLLAELLQRAGHDARLVQATLPAEAAQTALARVRLAPPRDPPAAQPVDQAALAADAARAAGLDPVDARASVARAMHEAKQRARLVESRVAEQQERLRALLDGAFADAPAAADTVDPLAAIADHWWVQTRLGRDWSDLDPLAPDAKPGDRLVPVRRAVARDKDGGFPIPVALQHRVAIRVVIEQFDGKRLVEQTVLDHTVRPIELLGRTIQFNHHVTAGPTLGVVWGKADGANLLAELRAVALKQTEWAPILFIDAEPIYQKGFTFAGQVVAKPQMDPAAKLGKGSGRGASGAGGLLGGMGVPDGGGGGGDRKDAAPTRWLTAERIEYHILAPGRETQVVRRDVFDLIDPSARAAGTLPTEPPTEAARANRALALAGSIEILPVACDVSEPYVAHLNARALVGGRAALMGLGRALVGRADAKTVIDRGAALPTLPGPTYALAVARHTWSNPTVYLDRANVLTYRHSMRIGGAGDLVACQGYDIAFNGVGVADLAGHDAAAARGARLRQGVLDTNAEAVLADDCGRIGNAAELFAARGGNGADAGEWLTVRSVDDPAWRAATALPADVRARVARDVAAGMVAVVPRAPVEVDGERQVAWWRVDPRTGEILGIGPRGWGEAAAEWTIAAKFITKTTLLLGCALVTVHARQASAARLGFSIAVCVASGVAAYVGIVFSGTVAAVAGLAGDAVGIINIIAQLTRDPE